MKPVRALSIVSPSETIESKIYLIRGKKVMLDRDLAILYGVETRALNQAVRRNPERFPDEFMFALTREEILRISQIVISLKFSNSVLAFTEQGVAMLSSVLKSKRAIRVNIQIMKTFTRLREMLINHSELRKKIEDMEKKYDHQFKIVFDALRQLLDEPQKPQRRIGFREPGQRYGSSEIRKMRAGQKLSGRSLR